MDSHALVWPLEVGMFNCTTKGSEKHYLYRGRILAVQGDQVDVCWEADRQVKPHPSIDDMHLSWLHGLL